MRKFQRAAVVAAALAGLSTLGVGVSFAGGNDDDTPQQITAVANSSANALATYGSTFGHPYGGPQQGHEDAAPQEGYGNGGGYSAPGNDQQ
ncbi:hypothetical protein AQI95_37575 [Streptomyces yokosukanensis]|uniref:Chaplin domain-containing protein n=1 Tax=Streptomyces yokosukanensis TaxID=67386 RepID=A0A117PYV8_9ACTN|nr:hypothetical protein [Streptomyces yokosukanensis]KUM99681.1 hypothetical protein AQI95_37575 [Streptomyces yokosukanensis]